MITIKKTAEFEKMAKAGRCVAEVHQVIRSAARPGVTTQELDDIASRVMQKNGCEPSFLGYGSPPFPGRICASPNDVIVHGIPNDLRLVEGDILSIDAGAIFDGYHGDAAFTIAIGEVEGEIQQLIDVTEKAMWAGIAEVRHGAKTGTIGAAVQAVAEARRFGVVREYVGHGIGRNMHEEPQIPNYGVRGKGTKLRTGMAICIEPMFNMGSADTKLDDDGWTVRTADGTLSAHWEHTVCLTPDGVVVTTVAADAQIPVSLG